MSESQFVEVLGRRIEYRYLDPPGVPEAPGCIVMLHEGLGSVAMWKDFPAHLAAATSRRVLAYSRFAYGRSDPLPQPYRTLEMQEREAREVLPALLEALRIERPILFGHSDGASIALIHAALAPPAVAGVVALAPHTFVEDMCIVSIEAARQAYVTTNLPQKLARYHDDPDRAFWSWNNIWLDPAFRAWNIERFLPRIRCPVLAIQGYQDEYGTMAQLDRLASGVPTARLVKLESCGHSPHRDQPLRVLEEVCDWLKTLQEVR